MADSPAPYGRGYAATGGNRRGAWDDDGWDAPTHTVSAAARRAGAEQPAAEPERAGGVQPTAVYGAPPPVRSRGSERSARADRSDRPDGSGRAQAAGRTRAGDSAAARRTERGVPGWAAVLVLIVIAAIGGAIDVLRGSAVKGAFNIALVVAAVVAILIVRRRAMFPVVVAPPLVYFVASALLLYVRSDGLHDRSRMLDAAINWLVYGFPAIAGATAAVLIIAGIRMVIRR